jgi:hypothetical protein|tara:strand:+ start:218 stop:487 length:270 start_codon:yes stop_codon:yes gene_type:complete
MKRVIGYAISIVGIAVMSFGFNMFKLDIAFLEGIGSNIIVGVGIAGIVGGVIIALMDGKGGGKVRHAKEEVPIYEGIGKNRKIVGYRKD